METATMNTETKAPTLTQVVADLKKAEKQKINKYSKTSKGYQTTGWEQRIKPNSAYVNTVIIGYDFDEEHDGENAHPIIEISFDEYKAFKKSPFKTYSEFEKHKNKQ
ncbi:hypothetical protein KY332_00275 [Candidatus Woesearchaeota archaeon]|nr:hypothetical protein [Candidatus Woesearchaeota archaeon]